MNPLGELQQAFLDAVFSASPQSKQAFCQQLQASDKLDTTEQLSIYSHSIYNGLIKALGEIYPVCERLTGEHFFYGLARHYLLQHPSHSPDLADYGEQFDNFISQFSAADELPYLGDVARLEWAYHRAFHCQDEAEIDLQQLAAYSINQLSESYFFLPASHSLIQSLYPVDTIWQFNQPEQHKEPPSLELRPATTYIYLYRKGYAIHIDRLSAEEWQFLRLIAQGLSFVEICDQLSSDPPRPTPQAPSSSYTLSMLLGKSLQNGWINRFHPRA